MLTAVANSFLCFADRPEGFGVVLFFLFTVCALAVRSLCCGTVARPLRYAIWYAPGTVSKMLEGYSPVCIRLPNTLDLSPDPVHNPVSK